MEDTTEIEKYIKNEYKCETLSTPELADTIHYGFNLVKGYFDEPDEDYPSRYWNRNRFQFYVYFTKNTNNIKLIHNENTCLFNKKICFMVRENVGFSTYKYELPYNLSSLKFIVGDKKHIEKDMEKYANLIHLSPKQYRNMNFKKYSYSIDLMLYNFFVPKDGDNVIRNIIKKMLIEMINIRNG